MNPLQRLQTFGQSVYLDEIRRGMLDDGFLQTLIERDGLHGVTSNPAIFQKAIAESDDYDAAIRELSQGGASVEEAYEVLVLEDIGRAADLFRGLHDTSGSEHGFVSLEVSPHLAHDAEATLNEARHLWAKLARPNVFIKIPGTVEGLAAIGDALAEGVNVNITLLFSLERYRAVAEIYLAVLETRAERGEDLSRLASVASFFLSRIDVKVDPLLERIMAEGGARAERAEALRGRIALASAKRAYAIYQELFGSARFERLKRQGARPQRLLWASTSTKNPDYPDLLYVEPLVGPETVNTMPLETLEAYRDHGEPASRLGEGVDEAAADLAALAELGLELKVLTDELEREGVEKFVKPFDSLLATLREAGKPDQTLA